MFSSYLKNIRGYFYFRIRVPRDLEHFFTYQEIQKSLHTKSPKEASKQVVLWAAKAEKVFSYLRTGILPPEQILQYIESQFPTRKSRPAIDKPKRLSKVIEAYVKEHIIRGKWTDKTKQEVESVLHVFRELIGDQQLSNIDRRSMVEVMENLQRLPANMNKKADYRDKSVRELLEMEGISPMSSSTVNKYLVRISSLFVWCMRQGYITWNPAEGLTISKSTKEDEERSAYTSDDLKKLIPSIVKYKIEAPERYFVPLIGMYSGARLNEICQLYIEDIKKIEDIWCFDINDEKDKRLKTISSRRIIPVHPRLVELGFLEYVQRIRDSGSERLWPKIERGRDGYSHLFGKWYQRHNRKHVTADPKRCFHSFRHTVADTLKQKGVQEGIIGEILGHANGSITTGRYGKRYRPDVLIDALIQLEY